MSIAPFTTPGSAVAGSMPGKNGIRGLAFSAWKIRTIHAAIANSDHQQRCGSYSTGRSPSRAGNAESATTRLPSAARSSPTISNPEEWEEHEETIIQTTSKLCTNGATNKRDRNEGITTRTNDSLSVPAC